MLCRLMTAILMLACALGWNAYRLAPKRLTPDERRAVAAAEVASRRAGWWDEGYEARSVSRLQSGWFVGVNHPGGYVGGHHGVMLDENLRLVRLVGGK